MWHFIIVTSESGIVIYPDGKLIFDSSVSGIGGGLNPPKIASIDSSVLITITKGYISPHMIYRYFLYRVFNSDFIPISDELVFKGGWMLILMISVFVVMTVCL